MNDQNFKHMSLSKFDFHKVFENFENPRIFWFKFENVFVLFYDVHKENMSAIKIEDGREVP